MKDVSQPGQYAPFSLCFSYGSLISFQIYCSEGALRSRMCRFILGDVHSSFTGEIYLTTRMGNEIQKAASYDLSNGQYNICFDQLSIPFDIERTYS